MDRGVRVPAAAFVAAVLWSAFSFAGALADTGHSRGDHILFSGQVTDAGGKPVGSVTVLLELSRTSFSVKRFKQVKKNTLRIPVTATVDGRYLHDWRWDGYYNTFELAVAVPVSADGRDDYEILYRVDITDSTRQAAPEPGQQDTSVVTPLVIEGAGDLEWVRRLVDGRAGAEERRVFREMGRPDRVDAYDPGAAAWWYFEAGRVYRFRDGALEQVEPFEPIPPLQ